MSYRDLEIFLSPTNIFPNVTSSGGGLGNFHFRVGVQVSEQTWNMSKVKGF